MEKGIALFSPGESHGQRNLAGYSPWGRKESDTTEVTQHTRHKPKLCLWALYNPGEGSMALGKT